MNTQQLVEIITDAVTDAVREALPQMIAKQLEALTAQAIAPALAKLDHALDGTAREVQEKITSMQADFAARGIAQAEALTASWERQVVALNAIIVEQVGTAVASVPSHAGAVGPPGPPGRDATFIPPVHWKADTNYSRGSVVIHGAGLWFANQESRAEPGSGGDGFTLMVDGHELASFECDGRGFLCAVLRYASGKVRTVETGFRPFRYAGVYDHATTYHLNDAVTQQGSMWMCKAVHTTGARPGTDEGARHWQLAVKAGRDGRDGLPGAKGERGDRGDAGPPGATVVRAPKQKANGSPP